MFDLTKEIPLEKESQKLYRKIQLFLYLTAFFLAVYLGYLIAFPHKYFSFNFLNPSSNQNNISEPRAANAASLTDRILPEEGSLYFDTDISSDYSKAVFALNLSPSSKKPTSLTVSIRRSYQAFMDNLGAPIGFRDGSLLKNDDNYYIVSASKLRKFSSANIAFSLGYTDKNFKEVTQGDLVYNTIGADVIAADAYPDDTLFRINDNYYILANQSLKKFVSDQAYLSRYDDTEALIKDVSFLNNYPSSDALAGFSDGTLIANAGSVYITSGEKILPIDNVQTFEDKGYDWKDVLNVGEDEVAMYQKDKLFNLKSVHPDGTVFRATENSNFYIIEKGQKHLLPGDSIASSWLKREAIPVSEKNLAVYAKCDLKNNFWNSSVYSCELPLNQFALFPGFTFEFRLDSTAGSKLAIDSISVDYQKNVSKNNFKLFLFGLYNSIRGTYAPTV